MAPPLAAALTGATYYMSAGPRVAGLAGAVGFVSVGATYLGYTIVGIPFGSGGFLFF